MNEFDPTEQETDDEALEIDLGEATKKEFKQWKAGDYEAIVSSVSSGISQAGNPQLIWVLSFPAMNNWTVKHYTGLTATGLWKTEEIVVALGIGEAGKKVVLNKRKAIGKRCMCKMKIEPYNGKDYGKVDKCFPHPDGPETEAPPF